MFTKFVEYIFKALSKIYYFSIFQWPNEPAYVQESKKINFVCQSLTYVSERMSTNLDEDILITVQNIPLFHFLVNKWMNWQKHKIKIEILFQPISEIDPGEDFHNFF